jgi:peptidoglycan/xylan/chitin deacetylase (PgdA/CDA1 family)
MQIKVSSTFLLIFIFSGSLLSQQAWIRINQLGYTEKAVKVAVLGQHNISAIRTFEIVDALTGKVAYTGDKISEYGAYASFSNTFRLNFSDFTQPGAYYIRVGNLSSPRFRISNDVWEGAADFLLRYMRQQRCGYNPFLKDSCHVHDGYIMGHPTLDSTFIDVTGGWHDASDYLQYVTTSANATYQMLFAYQQNPGAFTDKFDASGNPGSNGIPDILDEAKWGLNWLDKMNPSYGFMFNQIADDRDHFGFRLPNLDTVNYGKGLERPVYFVTGKQQGFGRFKNRSTGVSSTAAKYASAFSLGSEILKTWYPDFSKKIASKAEEAWKFAKSDLGVNQTASNRAPYFYEEDNYHDDMELAAIQLYQTTRDSNYLEDAVYWGELEPVTPWISTHTARHYQYYPFVNVGHYKIACEADSLNKAKFTGFLKRGIDLIYQRGKENGFLIGIPYLWCSNNLVAAMLTQMRLYNQLTGDNAYEELEASMRDWLFGCNPWGTSMIVGFPPDADTPIDPHSAFTAVYGFQTDGGLIDGPVYASIFNNLIGIRLINPDEFAPFQSGLAVYHDDYGDYSTNEPTMDGTASLTYYLSSMATQSHSEKPASCTFSHGGIIRGDESKKEVHLVFTGHEFNDGGDFIARILRKFKIKANFFFTGDFYRNPDFKETIRQLREDGHYLGAHSDKHLLYVSWEKRDSLLVSRSIFEQDLQNNYAAMMAHGIRREDAPLFMPPYEWYNDSISHWTKQLGLILLNFTPGTRSNADYTTPDMGDRYISSKEILSGILKFEKKSKTGLNGFLLLTHVGTKATRKDKFYLHLEKLISELIKRGYGFTLFNPCHTIK